MNRTLTIILKTAIVAGGVLVISHLTTKKDKKENNVEIVNDSKDEQ